MVAPATASWASVASPATALANSRLGVVSGLTARVGQAQFTPQLYASAGAAAAPTNNTSATLDALAVEQVRTYLLRMGGSASLGRLTSSFPGLKRVHLIPHFHMTPLPGGSDFIVTLGGTMPAATALGATTVARLPTTGIGMGMVRPFGQFESKKKKRRAQVPPDEPLPQLDSSIVQSIAEVLIEAGGALPLGKLTTQFEGVKKAQLEPHFAVAAHPSGVSAGDFTVSLLGADGTPMITDASAFLQPKLEEDLQPRGAKRKKTRIREKKLVDPDAPPPPELELHQVNEITTFLQLHGGCVRLGKLCTQFEGIKKVQLQPFFVIAGDPAVDMSVCIDLDTATAHGLAPVPPKVDPAALC
mmetsp:Transcript_53399/g.106241  ORF Transcript_53399/g.106241 Transcript_53399/m.106241 type:complete len:358 (+) Transcript_53399:63-1136(+)